MLDFLASQDDADVNYDYAIDVPEPDSDSDSDSASTASSASAPPRPQLAPRAAAAADAARCTWAARDSLAARSCRTIAGLLVIDESDRFGCAAALEYLPEHLVGTIRDHLLVSGTMPEHVWPLLLRGVSRLDLGGCPQHGLDLGEVLRVCGSGLEALVADNCPHNLARLFPPDAPSAAALRRVSVRGTTADDRFLRKLAVAAPLVAELDVSDCRFVSDNGLRCVAGLPLEALGASRTGVRDLGALGEALQSLRRLDLKCVADLDVASAAGALPRLDALDLKSCAASADEWAALLPAARGAALTRLKLGEADVSSATVRGLAGAARDEGGGPLVTLDLSWCDGVEADAAAAYAAASPKLEVRKTARLPATTTISTDSLTPLAGAQAALLHGLRQRAPLDGRAGVPRPPQADAVALRGRRRRRPRRGGRALPDAREARRIVG